jgi:hypothetical protein
MLLIDIIIRNAERSEKTMAKFKIAAVIGAAALFTAACSSPQPTTGQSVSASGPPPGRPSASPAVTLLHDAYCGGLGLEIIAIKDHTHAGSSSDTHWLQQLAGQLGTLSDALTNAGQADQAAAVQSLADDLVGMSKVVRKGITKQSSMNSILAFANGLNKYVEKLAQDVKLVVTYVGSC